MTRIGPRMSELADIVSAVPGISKYDALRAAGLPTHGLGSGRSLNRAINAGLIQVDAACPWVRGPAHALFASDLDRQLWHLRQELLKGSPAPERSSEILAEVDKIRAAQAAAYAEEGRT